ncbi:nickel pincer cofactor biosynthesis protein LarB [Balneolales bacterium ANBcel1]|nr:nickel pincer cofactor biosynthesis protein LarB [Balneolales bacterium ANBcel1]
MNRKTLETLLNSVRKGEVKIEDAIEKISDLPFRELGYAKIDHHRELRTGYPEIVFGQGKTREQIAGIVRSLHTSGSNVLVTRTGPEPHQDILEFCAHAEYHPEARCITIRNRDPQLTETTIGVITAGTSDIPVAEEAAVTAEIFDNRVHRIYDVGVAGIHRLFERLDTIRQARVLIVIAGMEGALPSVVGGLVDKPVIAVPTSIGYGANFGGISALLGMLTSCASGISVVNIDNGFGAAYQASMINSIGTRGSRQ